MMRLDKRRWKFITSSKEVYLATSGPICANLKNEKRNKIAVKINLPG